MSFEGYHEWLCELGHYSAADVYEATPKGCDVCDARFVRVHLVDQTNGTDENDPMTVEAPRHYIEPNGRWFTPRYAPGEHWQRVKEEGTVDVDRKTDQPELDYFRCVCGSYSRRECGLVAEKEREITHIEWVTHLLFIAAELSKDAHKRDKLEPCGLNSGAAMILAKSIRKCADYFENASRGASL